MEEVFLYVLLEALSLFHFSAWLWNPSWAGRNGCSSLHWFDRSCWDWSPPHQSV